MGIEPAALIWQMASVENNGRVWTRDVQDDPVNAGAKRTT